MEGCLLSHEKNGHATTRVELDNMLRRHQTQAIYMKRPEQAKPQRQKADRWLPGLGWGGGRGQEWG